MSTTENTLRLHFQVDGNGQVTSALSQTEAGLTGLEAAGARATSTLENLTYQATSFRGILAEFALAEAAHSIVESTIAWQGYGYTLLAATNSQRQTGAEMQFLTDTAEKLGISIQDAGEYFSRMVISSNGTGMSMRQVNDAFYAASEAMRVLHLDTNHTQRAFLALQEVMSQGQVTSRILNRQLAIDFPSALQALSLGLYGTTGDTQKLNEQMQNGGISASEFFAALTKGLHMMYDGSVKEAVTGLQATLTNLKNTFFELQNAIGAGGFGDALTGGARGLSEVLKSDADNADQFLGTLRLTGDALLAVAGIGMARWISSLTTATAESIKNYQAVRLNARAELEAAQAAQLTANEHYAAAEENLNFARTALQAGAALSAETKDITAANIALKQYQAAQLESAQAGEAATAASLRLAAAEDATAISARAAAGAAGAWDAAMAFVGGIPGLIMLGVGAIAALTLGMKSAADQADELDQKIKQMAGSMQDFASLAPAQQAYAIDLKSQQVSKLQDQLKQYQDDLASLANYSAQGYGDLAPFNKTELESNIADITAKLKTAQKQLADFDNQYLGLTHTMPAFNPTGLQPFSPNLVKIDQLPQLPKIHDAAGLANAGQANPFAQWAKDAQQQAQLAKQVIDTMHPDILLAQQQAAVQALVGTTVNGYTITAKDAADYMDKLKQKEQDISEFSKQAARNIQSSFADFLFDPFSQGLDGMLKGFLQVIQRMVAEAAASGILNSLFGSYDPGGKGSGSAGLAAIFSGFFKKSADGNVFSSGNIIPFANGGVFDQPFSFQMAGNQIGIGAEAGPEAIMPLARGADGKLGVRGGGGGNVVNFNAPVAPIDMRGADAGASARMMAYGDELERRIMTKMVRLFRFGLAP